MRRSPKTANTGRHHPWMQWWYSALTIPIFVLFLAWFNRPAADDYFYLGCLHDAGPLDCAMRLYDSFSGRWTAYSLNAFLMQGQHLPWVRLAFFTAMLGLCYFATYAVVRTFVPGKAPWLTPVAFTAWFTCTYNIAETWFWYVQVCTYLLPLALMGWLWHALCRGFGLFRWLVIAVAGTFIGGASETYALTTLLALVILFFKPRLTGFSTDRSGTVIALLIVTASFTFTAMAPGNAVRFDALPHGNFAEWVVIYAKACTRLVLVHQLKFIPLLLACAVPFFITGSQIEQTTRTSMRQWLRRRSPGVLMALVIWFALLGLPVAIMFQMPPDRVLALHAVSMVMGVLWLAFDAGRNVSWTFTELKTRLLLRVSAFLPLGWLLIVGHEKVVQAHDYSVALDERTVELLRIEPSAEDLVIEVPPLPPSGWLYSAEISDNPAHFTNVFYADALQLPFRIRVVKAD